MSLRVLSTGACTMIVDRGRPTARPLGVAVGGPADVESWAIGNAILGNDANAAALEIALVGPTLLADCDVGVVVSGAPFTIWVDGEPQPVHEAWTLRAGQSLKIGPCSVGCRAYVGVRGGIGAPLVLGSRTSLAPVQAGDTLAVASHAIDRARFDRLEWQSVTELRCLHGPQFDWFDHAFFQNLYRVSTASNRMGLRLDGPAIPRPTRELVSEPVSPGAIQITNDGRPIVLGVDGQTIGGYPKIAHVISADLDRLGQLRPGDPIRFKLVGEDEAEYLGREYRHRLQQTIRAIGLGRQRG